MANEPPRPTDGSPSSPPLRSGPDEVVAPRRRGGMGALLVAGLLLAGAAIAGGAVLLGGQRRRAAEAEALAADIAVFEERFAAASGGDLGALAEAAGLAGPLARREGLPEAVRGRMARVEILTRLAAGDEMTARSVRLDAPAWRAHQAAAIEVVLAAEHPGWGGVVPAEVVLNDTSGHGGSATFKCTRDSAPAAEPVGLHVMGDQHSHLASPEFVPRVRAVTSELIKRRLAPRRLAENQDKWYVDAWEGGVGKGGYKAARKSKWGDLWAYDDPRRLTETRTIEETAELRAFFSDFADLDADELAGLEAGRETPVGVGGAKKPFGAKRPEIVERFVAMEREHGIETLAEMMDERDGGDGEGDERGA